MALYMFLKKNQKASATRAITSAKMARAAPSDRPKPYSIRTIFTRNIPLDTPFTSPARTPRLRPRMAVPCCCSSWPASSAP